VGYMKGLDLGSTAIMAVTVEGAELLWMGAVATAQVQAVLALKLVKKGREEFGLPQGWSYRLASAGYGKSLQGCRPEAGRVLGQRQGPLQTLRRGGQKPHNHWRPGPEDHPTLRDRRGDGLPHERQVRRRLRLLLRARGQAPERPAHGVRRALPPDGEGGGAQQHLRGLRRERNSLSPWPAASRPRA
jgi:hypothetical protein